MAIYVVVEDWLVVWVLWLCVFGCLVGAVCCLFGCWVGLVLVDRCLAAGFTVWWFRLLLAYDCCDVGLLSEVLFE